MRLYKTYEAAKTALSWRADNKKALNCTKSIKGSRIQGDMSLSHRKASNKDTRRGVHKGV